MAAAPLPRVRLASPLIDPGASHHACLIHRVFGAPCLNVAGDTNHYVEYSLQQDTLNVFPAASTYSGAVPMFHAPLCPMAFVPAGTKLPNISIAVSVVIQRCDGMGEKAVLLTRRSSMCILYSVVLFSLVSKNRCEYFPGVGFFLADMLVNFKTEFGCNLTLIKTPENHLLLLPLEKCWRVCCLLPSKLLFTFLLRNRNFIARKLALTPLRLRVRLSTTT